MTCTANIDGTDIPAETLGITCNHASCERQHQEYEQYQTKLHARVMLERMFQRSELGVLV